MAIKDLIEQVGSKLPDEVKSEVGSILKQIENEANDLQSSLTAANSESKGRKLELRELKTKLDDTEIEKTALQKTIDGLNEKIKDPSKDKELESLRTFKKSTIQANRQVFINEFEKIKDHPKFEKAQSKFKLPEKNGEEFNWDTVEDTDMEANMNVLRDLKDLDYFADEKGGKGGFAGQGGKGSPPLELAKIYEKRNAGDPSWREDYEKFRQQKQS